MVHQFSKEQPKKKRGNFQLIQGIRGLSQEIKGMEREWLAENMSRESQQDHQC